MSLLEGISGLLDDGIGFVSENPGKTALIGVGAVAAGAGIAALVKRKGNRKKKTARGRKRDRKYISKQKHEKAYIRRKKRAGKRITRKSYKTKGSTSKRKGVKYTKNGQPYILKANGQARFIKGKRRK